MSQPTTTPTRAARGPRLSIAGKVLGLLAASGLVGASAGGELELPTRMAEVNAMLDVAAPAMREALLKAFLDRLQRPARGAAR